MPGYSIKIQRIRGLARPNRVPLSPPPIKTVHRVGKRQGRRIHHNIRTAAVKKLNI